MENETSSVFVIADYGIGDPAFAEVNQRITALAGNPRIEIEGSDQALRQVMRLPVPDTVQIEITLS